MGVAWRSRVIFENRYGFIDRLLHRIAFGGGRAQQALADVEDLLIREELQSTHLGVPVFICGLPRSGTTILLDLLFRSGSFACHIYRDMPFILCPALWSRFSKHFSVRDSPRERAHGDGLIVSGDHPEAFEDMIWKHFWKNHYEVDRIRPWQGSASNPEFARFMESHMKKIVMLRTKTGSGSLRYLSKNNTSIARLSNPPPPLDRGLFLVPFREPLQQAASMLRQHRRFLEIQQDDGFVSLYMDAIGHHEFGAGLRPIDFDGWLANAPDATTVEFWLTYWLATYRHVLEHKDSNVVLISYDQVTADPERRLVRLEKILGIPGNVLSSQATRIHPPRNHIFGAAEIPADLRDSARDVYDRLRREATI